MLGLLRSTTNPLATGFRAIGRTPAAACNRWRNVGLGSLQDRRRGELPWGEVVRVVMLENTGFGDGPSYTLGILRLIYFLRSSTAAALPIFSRNSLLDLGLISLLSSGVSTERLRNFNSPLRYFRKQKKKIRPNNKRPPTTPATAPPAMAALFDAGPLLLFAPSAGSWPGSSGPVAD